MSESTGKPNGISRRSALRAGAVAGAAAAAAGVVGGRPAYADKPGLLDGDLLLVDATEDRFRSFGVYVLENLDHAEIRHGLMYSVFDLFENGPRRDWSKDLAPIFARSRAPAAAAAAAPARATSPPSLPLEHYAGTYVDSAYGTVRVTFQEGVLEAAVVTDPVLPLEPVSFEAFRTKPSEGARPTVLTFVPDGSGGVSGLRVLNILFARAKAQR